ncbi:type II toxin-antitoxin system VapC family toxin [Methylobacterium sp. NEAU 140]|uniref:type II toxin-antitoxin system VapC family toxin n=1 Tax=Methylobacterium sp. NEAU 140 TaxID=3064945 RepID=UPI00273324CA|nr:type II toxin-antitoxin system VapC family toxin [Methylobacterium sp. NEAU 140]MDP4022292.1 type II toxin-antitoxin system VapC family toxin [Methylobacterium sp. NEAU 140]
MSGAAHYILDTNILSDLINRGRDSAIRNVLAGLTGRVHTSVVVAAEIRYGVAKKGSRALAERVEAVLGTIPILPLAPPADLRYGEIRAELERSGRLIGPNDMLIAAQCLALDMHLVTDNGDEFRRVPGLTVENWLMRSGDPAAN